jgi:hypothetical protein
MPQLCRSGTRRIDRTIAFAGRVPFCNGYPRPLQSVSQADRVYVCLWSHVNGSGRTFIWLIQPAWNRWSDAYSRPGPFGGFWSSQFDIAAPFGWRRPAQRRPASSQPAAAITDVRGSGCLISCADIVDTISRHRQFDHKPSAAFGDCALIFATAISPSTRRGADDLAAAAALEQRY